MDYVDSSCLRNIREEDYGNYTCVATNSLGAARREVTVSGRPLAPSLVPGTRGHTRTEYVVRWRVHSAFPVREHNIYYERIAEVVQRLSRIETKPL